MVSMGWRWRPSGDCRRPMARWPTGVADVAHDVDDADGGDNDVDADVGADQLTAGRQSYLSGQRMVRQRMRAVWM